MIGMWQIESAMDDSLTIPVLPPAPAVGASLVEVSPSQPGRGGVICGVYSFVHRATGRRYIGSSKNIYRRRTQHFQASKYDKKSVGNYAFHKALRELGIESFDFEVLEICAESERFDREGYFITLYDSASLKGFNTQPNPMPRFNFEVNEATRQRMSLAQRGATWKRLGFRGHHTPETRLKLSEIAKKNGRRPPIFHGHHNPETLARFSKAMKGNKWAVGYRHTSEALAKISAASVGNKYGLGHVHSPEVRARISASMKQYRQNQKHHAND